MSGKPDYPAWHNEPGPTPRLVVGSLEDLKATVAFGGMHLCRFEDCEVWVADGGDHKCVLHSDDPWAVEMRDAFLDANEMVSG